MLFIGLTSRVGRIKTPGPVLVTPPGGRSQLDQLIHAAPGLLRPFLH
jgi:hypothetical protein